MPTRSDQQLADLLPFLDPEGELPQRALRATHDSAVGLFLIPTGGEADGFLTLAALAAEEVQDPAEALLALWKISYCLDGEPYAPWDSAMMAWILGGPYREQVSTWAEDAGGAPVDGVKWLQWLRTGAERTIRAQFEGAKARNQPTYLPGEAEVLAAGLTEAGLTQAELSEMAFLRLEHPHWILSDHWNECGGLFRAQGHWYFAEWGTNA